MREFSFVAIVLGVVVGALLAAANAFVGLKIGMTISASIPAAVMSLLILRVLLKRSSLLESNMVQTVGSAGESVASGMIFVFPAMFMMGHHPAYLQMVMWGAIGGMLGVCFMVPLRHVLIVKEHGTLPFPEGVACAEVLESGERGGGGARSVIKGGIVGGVYYLLNALGFFQDTGVVSIKRFHTQAELDSSPALLGVGYILGPRIAAYMLSGAVLGWFVLIPAISFFGAGAQAPVFPSETTLVSQMEPGGADGMWGKYIRYIGAGAVAIGGLISLIKGFPTILASVWRVLGGAFGAGRGKRDRTEKDLPFLLIVLIVAALGYAMWRVPQVNIGPLGAVAVLVFTFFFVTVSARLVGLVGCSSNPISGMTIATILATALVYRFFVAGDMTAMSAEALFSLKITCLSVGALVCIAIAVAGDTSQDLKTGYLVKATPYKQQMGEMIGVLTSVVAIAGVMLLLNHTSGFGEPTPEHPHPLPAYQASIMRLLVDGVLGGQVPWTLIMIGGAAAVIVEMLGLPSLPFAVGLYLPLGLSTPIMAGGIVRWMVDRKRKEKSEHDPGVLTAAGLVAGKGLMGVAVAGATALIAWWWGSPHWKNPMDGAEAIASSVSPAHLVPWLWAKLDWLPERWGLTEAWWDALPLLVFAPMLVWLWWRARRKPTFTPPPPGTTVAAGPSQPILPLMSAPDAVPPSAPSALGSATASDPQRARTLERLINPQAEPPPPLVTDDLVDDPPPAVLGQRYPRPDDEAKRDGEAEQSDQERGLDAPT